MQVFMCLIFIFVLLTNFLVIQAIRYNNYSLYDAYPKNQNQKTFLMGLERNRHLDIILLNDPRENEITQILVHRAHQHAFVEKATLAHLQQEFLYIDVQSEFDKQLKSASRQGSDKIYERIQSYEDIKTWLYEKAANYTDIARAEVIGTSAEGRDIIAFSVKQPTNMRYKSLKIIFECGIHGDEWLSVNFGTYMIDQLLQMREDSRWKQFFWYFIPVLNPDGYEYSLRYDRLWKKNRRKLDDKNIGVNLNRNFDYNFGMNDTDSHPESPLYPGPSAFSEPETQAMRDFLERKQEDLMFYFAVHGHGEKFIIPYSDSTKHVVNYHQVMSRILKGLSHNFTSSIVLNNSTIIHNPSTKHYRIGNAHEILGKLYSGDSVSYVKKKYYVTYAMAIQLRDNGEYGTLMPNEQVLPTLKEMGDSLFGLVDSTEPLSVLASPIFAESEASTSIKITLGFFIMIFLVVFN